MCCDFFLSESSSKHYSKYNLHYVKRCIVCPLLLSVWARVCARAHNGHGTSRPPHYAAVLCTLCHQEFIYEYQSSEFSFQDDVDSSRSDVSPHVLKSMLLWNELLYVKTRRWHLFHCIIPENNQWCNLRNLAGWTPRFGTNAASPPPRYIFITQLRGEPCWMEVMARRKKHIGWGLGSINYNHCG